ncbi:DUF7144 family membrane protein [Nocardia sp. MW-W600-9]
MTTTMVAAPPRPVSQGVAAAVTMLAVALLLVASILEILCGIAIFASLPYYPWWSVVVILLDLAVLWAVSTWEPDRY